MYHWIKQALPKPVTDVIRPWYNCALNLSYERYLRHQHLRKDRLLILGTIQKSGLHYMRFFLSNYVRLLSGTSHGPVVSKEMHSMFPNTWYEAYINPQNYLPATPHLRLIDLDDISRTHSPYQQPFWDQSKVLHLYRNPLDYAVSNFFYTYEYRSSRAGRVSGPVETLWIHLAQYAKSYVSYRDAVKSGNSNIYRLSYEELITNPNTCFSRVLDWLGVKVNPDALATAAQYSHRDTIRSMEEQDGPLVYMIEDFTGTFVRDGSIGQWKQYFSPTDLDKVQEQLHKYHIGLDEFVVEA